MKIGRGILSYLVAETICGTGLAESLNRLQTLTLLSVILAFTVWLPIGLTGLTKTDAFSIHMIHMIDAGILSYQPWTDQNDIVHPFREYGWANLLWNASNIIEGFQVESYNFSNVPNVVSIDWDFQGLIAKVQDGAPVYDQLFPSFRPVFPFDGTNFQIGFQSFKSYHAQWPGNSTVYYSDAVGNITGNLSTWADADYGLRSQIDTNVTRVVQELPRSIPVRVNFTSDWQVRATISSMEAGVRGYNVGFDRRASVSMVVKNGTLLSGAGNFYVHTSDASPVEITYRTISLANTYYATIAIILAASTVSILAFRRELGKLLRFRASNRWGSSFDL